MLTPHMECGRHLHHIFTELPRYRKLEMNDGTYVGFALGSVMFYTDGDGDKWNRRWRRQEVYIRLRHPLESKKQRAHRLSEWVHRNDTRPA